MVEIDNSEIAVIANEGESAIELDSSQLVAMTHIDCVIKEDDITARQASRAHPPQCAVRIDDARFEMAARPVNHDVVVAQISAICTCFQDRRILYPHGSSKVAVVTEVTVCFEEPSRKR